MAYTPGGYNQIFVDIDIVTQMLSRLMSNLEEFPDPDAVAQTSGPTGDGAVGAFSNALADAAKRARHATVETRAHLLEMDQAIREVVTALTEFDATATADANRLFDVLDDAAADVTAETTSDGTTRADSTIGPNATFGSLS